MDDILNNTRSKIRFLYCPRCGLRKPASSIFGYYGGRCPACGSRMIERNSLLNISGNSKQSLINLYNHVSMQSTWRHHMNYGILTDLTVRIITDRHTAA